MFTKYEASIEKNFKKKQDKTNKWANWTKKRLKTIRYMHHSVEKVMHSQIHSFNAAHERNTFA